MVMRILHGSRFDKGIVTSLTKRQLTALTEALRRIEHAYYSEGRGFIGTVPYGQIIEMAVHE